MTIPAGAVRSFSLVRSAGRASGRGLIRVFMDRGAVAVGLTDGEATGFARGRHVGQRSRDEGDAFDTGRDDGMRHGLALASSSAVAGAALPALSVNASSPTPGASPGSAGGFPSDFPNAEATPILIQIPTIANAAYVCVVATFRNFPSVGQQITECVYRRGVFQANYVPLSSQVVAGGTLTLTCARLGGWPVGTGALGDIVFDVDAVNLSGILT